MQQRRQESPKMDCSRLLRCQKEALEYDNMKQ
jgi:hypothetical protein